MRDRHGHEVPTPAQRIERTRRQVDGRLRLSPASRYTPAYRFPTMADGSLDVRAWCADLDAAFNPPEEP